VKTEIKCLPAKDCIHKNFWEHDKTRLHMHTTGMHAIHLDAKLDMNFMDLEGLPIRQQREIIKQKAREANNRYPMRNQY